MKKLLLVVVIAFVAVGITSCKKEVGAKPEIQTQTERVADKKDTSSWD